MKKRSIFFDEEGEKLLKQVFGQECVSC